MSEGQGSISYSSESSGSSGGIVVAGARNGLSVDASGYIVLGQSVAHAANPAKMLDDQEIPMQAFTLNLFDGVLVVSNERQASPMAGLLQVVQNELGTSGTDTSFAVINTTQATGSLLQNSPGILLEGQSWDSTNNVSKSSGWLMNNIVDDGPGTSAGEFALSYVDNGGTPVPQLQINSFGQTTLNQLFAQNITSNSYEFRGITSGDLYTMDNGSGDTGDGTIYVHPLIAANPTSLAAANMDDTGANREYFKLGWNNTPNMLILSVERQGTGVLRPVAFLPSIRHGDNTPPTAVIDITPGTAALGPLRLNAGTNVTTPLNGLFEFDGTNLYFTVGGTRKTVTLI
jgi:hypothetical protein